MAGLLSTSEIANFTGIFARHFDTFSHERARLVTVYREPIKNITSTNTTFYPGYQSQQNNVASYTPVYQSFPAVVRYISEQATEPLHEIKSQTVRRARVKILVEENCKNYIDGAKVEKLEVDGIPFNLTSEKGVRNFLGLKHYYYYIEQTS